MAIRVLYYLAYPLVPLLFIATFASQLLIGIIVVNPLQPLVAATLIENPAQTMAHHVLLFSAFAAAACYWFELVIIRRDYPDLFSYPGVITMAVMAFGGPLLAEHRPDHYGMLMLMLDIFMVIVAWCFIVRSNGTTSLDSVKSVAGFEASNDR